MQGVLRGSFSGRYPHPARTLPAPCLHHTVLCWGTQGSSLHHLLSCSGLGLGVLGLPGLGMGLSWIWVGPGWGCPGSGWAQDGAVLGQGL